MHDATTFHRATRPPRRAHGAQAALRAIGLLISMLLASCGGGSAADVEPPPPNGVEIVNLTRQWEFRTGNFFDHTPTGYPKQRLGYGALADEYKFGADMALLTIGRGPDSWGEINSSHTGQSYGTIVDAPNSQSDNGFSTSSGVVYTQHQFYRKVSGAAWLELKITALTLEAVDGNTRFPPGCDSGNAPDCPLNVDTHVDYGVRAVRVADNRVINSWYGFARLSGLMSSWEDTSTENRVPLTSTGPGLAWNASDLQLSVDDEGGLYRARLVLKQPKTLRVSLDGLAIGETFYLKGEINSGAQNHRQGETAATALFQDPVSGGGIELTAVGVEPAPVPDPLPSPPATPISTPTCSSGPVEAAGRFELQAATLPTLEGKRLRLRIKRVAGNLGLAGVTVATLAGTATAVTDFPSFTQTVVFGDGQDEDRVIDLWIPDDDLLEGDETFDIRLSEAQGCAALGAVAQATVTIADDETVEARYTLGGTVSGLVGSGLFVRSNGFDVRVDASGPFTLPGTFATGTVYALDVEVQPSNPLQVCRVTNGQGTIANANVTDLAVVCDPPAPPPAGGALDPTFAGGMVSNPSHGRILSMALQPDGRVVVLTDFNKLLRYQVDGTLDPSFGSAGVVSATLGGSALDLLRAVAVQADGGILVAGLARASGGSASGDDMGVTRYLPNGTVDTSFGTAGFVRVDIAGRAEDANSVLVQPDGKIVLGGLAVVTAVGASDFALARLDATGALDAGFGNGGTLTVNAGGALDIAAAIARQADGAIVLVGRTATSGAATPDSGVVRVSASGVVELALKLPLTAYWDEATGVAIQPDGKIVLTLEARPDSAGLYQHALARLKPDGTLDESFGTLGVALAGFSVGGDHARAPALLADGRIVTAGFARNQVQQLTDKDDFLITRHLPDGALDSGFGSGGKLIVDFFGAADGASALLLQPDGKLLVGGLARSGTNNGLGLLRLLP